MSEESNTPVEKNIPVFIETDGHVVQVGLASEVQENGGRIIEKFSAFKKVVLVNPVFGKDEMQITNVPFESNIDPDEEGLTESGIKGLLQDHGVEVGEVTVDGHPIDPAAPSVPAPVEAGTNTELDAERVDADPDGSDLLEDDAPAENEAPQTRREARED